MRTSLLAFVSIVLLAGCSPEAKTSLTELPTPPSSATNSNFDESSLDVILLSPQPDSRVTSPLKISAKAPGSWFFEASIPLELTDSNGTVLANAVGQVEGGWMTVNAVTFDAEFTFHTNASDGFIVIKKDNPSGLPENDSFVKFPVKF